MMLHSFWGDPERVVQRRLAWLPGDVAPSTSRQIRISCVVQACMVLLSSVALLQASGVTC